MRDGSTGFFSTLVSWFWTVLFVGGAVLSGVRVAQELDVVALSKWASLPSFLSVPLQRQGDNAIIATLAGVVACFLMLFLLGYVLQSLLDALRLGLVARAIKKRSRRLDDPRTTSPEQWRWFYYSRFTRLWREFALSLQAESLPDLSTGATHTRLIASLPPEVVFSHQALVDVPMRVEFFRHLPGILTGAGIVSTFAGILMGLTGFDPSVGADQVTRELQGLFMGVSTAFSASFFAIVTAMLVTVVEKLLLHWRYAQVLAFQGLMNRRFGMGSSSGESRLRDASARTLWEEPVQRIVESVARLEPLLLRDRDDREEATLGVSLGLSGVMATVERAFETWSARESKQQEAMRTLSRDLVSVGRGVENLLTRQLAGMEEEAERVAERAKATQERLEARLANLEGLLERLAGREESHTARLESALERLGAGMAQVLEQRLSSLQGEGTGAQEVLTQGMRRLADSGEGLALGLERLGGWLEEEARRSREERQGVGARLEALGERLGGHLEAQSSWMQARATELGVALEGVSQGLETVGNRLEGQLEQQVALMQAEQVSRRTGFGAVVGGLEKLNGQLGQQREWMQEESVFRRQEMGVLASGLENLDRRLENEGVLWAEEREGRRDGMERVVGGLRSLEEGLHRQWAWLQEESTGRQSGLGALTNSVEGVRAQLAQQLPLWQEEAAERQAGLLAVTGGIGEVRDQLAQQLPLLREETAGRQAGLLAVTGGIEGVREQLARQLPLLQELTAAHRESMGGLTGGVEALGSRLDRQLSVMEAEAGIRREGIAGVSRHLSELRGALEHRLEEQSASLESLAVRHGEWIRRGEEGLVVLRELAGRIDAGDAESRLFREQAMESAGRLRQGMTELTTRMPSGAEVSGWIREAALEWSSALEGRQARLVEGMRAAHGELLARVDAGVAAIEGVRADEAVVLRLLEGVTRRLDAMQGGWQESMVELAGRVAQVSGAMDATLKDLLLRVERVASSGEEGMALLFGEMGREMERMRRQIRESAGQVALQTREWLLSSGAGGEEKLQTLMRGVSEEFKSALTTLADERSQLDGDRESALMERLLSQTAEQAEGVKMAVLGELDETARQIATHLRVSGEELIRSREDTARDVVTVIAERMDTAFGGVAQELAEMRKRLVAEQKAMENSLQAWVNEASRSTMEENRVLAQRLMEVQSHFDERHQGVIGVIDQLGQGLERDLEQLRDGLYHKNEESSRHVEAHLTELGQLLEGVVTSLGREQSVFIEMLGERLDSLRRRLRVK
ncbi:MAG: hypothetical protein HQL98_09530 [Magnetococcales bacterium]|nr:hypothetical protein [Magnetococcales bacterium]